MTLNDVMSMSWDDLNKLNKKELQKVARVVVDVANKRLKRLELADANNEYIAIQALESARAGGGKFKTAKKNINELRSEINRARLFVQAKTSKINVAKQVYNARERSIFGNVSKSPAERQKRRDQSKRIGDLYHKFTESKPQIYNTISPKEGIKIASEIIKDNPNVEDVDLLLEEMEKRYAEEYENESYEVDPELWGL